MADNPSSSSKSETFLSRKEASDYLRREWNYALSVGSLTNMASRGIGPLMVYHSRFPRYAISDLDAYAKSRIGPRVQSASEGRMARRAA